MEVFNYGVYGVGRIGRVHAQILQSQGHNILCIGDENEQCVQEAGEILGVAKENRFTSKQEMVEKCGKEMTAVVVASHTKYHARDAIPFVEAKIPVYLEKPLTDDLEESFDFIKKVGTDRNIIQIGLQRHFDDALCHGKWIIEQGIIGKIREIRSILRDQYPPPPTYSSKGILLDMAVHVADEICWLMDDYPNKVWARIFDAIDYNSPIDEGGNTSFVTFTTPNKIIGRLDLSRTHSSGYNNETYVMGTKGTLHIGRFNGYPGPIPVEVWTPEGKLDEEHSKTFQMTYDLKKPYAEFLPRFKKAFVKAHLDFQEKVRAGRANFRVTQTEVFYAQIFTVAADQSAKNGSIGVEMEKIDDLEKLKEMCIKNKIM